MNARTAIVMPWLRAGFDVLLCSGEGRVRELRGAAEPADASAGGRNPGSGLSGRGSVPASGAFRRPQASVPSAEAARSAAVGNAAAQSGAGSVPGGSTVPPMGAAGGPQSWGAQSGMPDGAPGPRGYGRPAPSGKFPPGSGSVMRTPPPGGTPVRPDAPEPQGRPSLRGAEAASAAGALPFEQWPGAWRALRSRRPMPEHPLVMWTYGGLGDDLTGTPDADRREVIVRMLRMLGHPGGTHVFWPYALPGDDPPEGASLFWSGVRLFAPRVLLLFGSDARDALAMPRTLLPFSQERVDGRLIIQLPRPQAFVGDEAAFARAQVFLGRLLQFCTRRPA